MPFRAGLKNLTAFSMAGVMLALLFFTLGQRPATLAQGNPKYVRQVRVLENDQIGVQHPAGLAFSPGANAFHVVEARGPGQVTPPDTEFVKVDAYEEQLGSARIVAAIKDPNNLAFDGYTDRLLILQPAAKQLIEVLEGSDGNLDPKTLVRHDARHFGLEDPRGMAVDPGSGHLFILDGVGPRIVRVEPDPSGGFAGAVVSESDLGSTGLEELQGLAFDRTSGHLHVVSLADQGLYELSQAGQVVAVRDLSQFEVDSPQSMVFAPSGDQTDDPMQMNLYLADGQQVVELSFVQVVAPAAAGFTSTLVQTIEANQWSPPSPDSAGIVYLPGSGSGTLLISDSEVNEMTIPPNTVQYMGVNLFESTLTGALVNTMTTWYTPTQTFSDEPTGVTLDPSGNGRLFFSDDTGGPTRSIYEVDLGSNKVYDWPGDTVTSFSAPSSDPEGVTYCTDCPIPTLWIADGMSNEIYQVTAGQDGDFGTGDDQTGSFNTASMGLLDPEGIAYNPDTGNLYVVGEPVSSLFEVTIEGARVRTIDISAASAVKPAGLAYAPSSVPPSVMNIYIAARGVDNDSKPDENDGRVYEMTLPTNPPPVAVDDNAGTLVNTPKIINVAANDSDPGGNPLALSSANTNCENVCSEPSSGALANNGNGTFTYTPSLNFSGIDNFVYEICDTEPACDTAKVTITVSSNNSPPVAVDDSTSTTVNTPVPINVAGNDSDPDGNLDPNSANSTCATGCNGAANGSLTDNGDGTITYTPNQGFRGSDNFVYEICDTGALCDTATVTIAVDNDPPVAVDDSARTTVNKPVTIDVASNDNDPNGNLDLASTKTTCDDCNEPVNGALVNNGDGTFDYTPNSDFIGGDTFVYEICDTLGACDTAIVSVKVTEPEVFIPLLVSQ